MVVTPNIPESQTSAKVSDILAEEVNQQFNAEKATASQILDLSSSLIAAHC
jgi:hypothetical protein